MIFRIPSERVAGISFGRFLRCIQMLRDYGRWCGQRGLQGDWRLEVLTSEVAVVAAPIPTMLIVVKCYALSCGSTSAIYLNTYQVVCSGPNHWQGQGFQEGTLNSSAAHLQAAAFCPWWVMSWTKRTSWLKSAFVNSCFKKKSFNLRPGRWV